MAKVVKTSFLEFIQLFPVIELPITLSEESQGHFSKANPPIPAQYVQEYIAPLQKTEIDELTEFLACFQIPNAKEFVGIVYWKASLMTYEYILATFTNKGVLIDQQVLAGTTAEGAAIARTVATIDEEWDIFIVGGVEILNANTNDGTNSEAMKLTITDQGQVVVDNSAE